MQLVQTLTIDKLPTFIYGIIFCIVEAPTIGTLGFGEFPVIRNVQIIDRQLRNSCKA